MKLKHRKIYHNHSNFFLNERKILRKKRPFTRINVVSYNFPELSKIVFRKILCVYKLQFKICRGFGCVSVAFDVNVIIRYLITNIAVLDSCWLVAVTAPGFARTFFLTLAFAVLQIATEYVTYCLQPRQPYIRCLYEIIIVACFSNYFGAARVLLS